mmetsp:Transcript_722/g.2866  ORF Transcript_722/g.2866 Transcript_722/m.2866 type:complete len:126 (+) Transcript_722:60-437(+)
MAALPPPNPDDHPILKSVRDAIDAVLVFESAMHEAEETGGSGDPAKAALQTVMDKLHAMGRIAREHPDGDLEVPEGVLLCVRRDSRLEYSRPPAGTPIWTGTTSGSGSSSSRSSNTTKFATGSAI